MTSLRVRTVALAVVILLSLASLGVVAETTVERATGRPKFSEGKAFGYFLWKEGDTWKVRWTTFGLAHRFNGRVMTEDGEFKSLKRIDVDAERRVIAPGRPPHVVRGPAGRVRGVAGGRPAVVATREEDHIGQENERLIRFATRTDDDIDGFDFKVTDSTRVLRFRLEIDGMPKPQDIVVGRDNVRPAEDPLVIRLR